MSDLSSLLAKFKKGPASQSTSTALGRVEDSGENTQLIKALAAFHQNQLNVLAAADEDSGNKGDAVCLCFIIIDSLPHEFIWRTWLKQAGDEAKRVHIYIHAKYPNAVRSAWVKERLVPFSLHPAWGSIDLTATMIKLLEYVRKKVPLLAGFKVLIDL